MPKLIGHSPRVGTVIVGKAPNGAVKLSYSQQVRLPANVVTAVLDCSDRGGPRQLAKRWYRWYAMPDAIKACSDATPRMLAKAA